MAKDIKCKVHKWSNAHTSDSMWYECVRCGAAKVEGYNKTQYFKPNER